MSKHSSKQIKVIAGFPQLIWNPRNKSMNENKTKLLLASKYYKLTYKSIQTLLLTGWFALNLTPSSLDSFDFECLV